MIVRVGDDDLAVLADGYASRTVEPAAWGSRQPEL